MFDLPAVRGKFSCKSIPKFTARPELGRTNPYVVVDGMQQFLRQAALLGLLAAAPATVPVLGGSGKKRTSYRAGSVQYTPTCDVGPASSAARKAACVANTSQSSLHGITSNSYWQS